MSQIKQALFEQRNEEQIANLSRFFKTGKGQYGEGDHFLGIKVPITRKIVKDYWKESAMSDVEELIVSPFHEARLCGLLLLIRLYLHHKTERAQHIAFYLNHTSFINNWDLVDLSCYPLLGHWLLDKNRDILYDLARNGHTIWEQRIGIVTCLQFIRNNQFEDVLNIADLLLHHQHDLIQKATGWMLREVGKRDKDLLTSYLLPRYKSMPRTALRYAIEKFSAEERHHYLHENV